MTMWTRQLGGRVALGRTRQQGAVSSWGGLDSWGPCRPGAGTRQLGGRVARGGDSTAGGPCRQGRRLDSWGAVSSGA
eukprot:5204367-Heterocapsa_arctica.AAC.1